MLKDMMIIIILEPLMKNLKGKFEELEIDSEISITNTVQYG